MARLPCQLQLRISPLLPALNVGRKDTPISCFVELTSKSVVAGMRVNVLKNEKDVFRAGTKRAYL